MDFVSAAAPVARLIEELHKLPGVGPKTAQRLAYHLIRVPKEEALALADALQAVKERVNYCSQCQNITDIDPCTLCASQERDRTKLCVVEEPLDIFALERTRTYRGLYHVLHGVISPLNGVGPKDLKIRELVVRLKEGAFTELILATNPSLEGEATALYIYRQVTPFGLKITFLARGLPAGADLDYADEVTLTRALEGRQEMS